MDKDGGGSPEQRTTFLSRKSEQGIVTSSRWRAWWLVKMKGYVVLNVRHMPKQGAFGRLKYDSIWFLDEPSNGKTKQ